MPLSIPCIDVSVGFIKPSPTNKGNTWSLLPRKYKWNLFVNFYYVRILIHMKCSLLEIKKKKKLLTLEKVSTQKESAVSSRENLVPKYVLREL